MSEQNFDLYRDIAKRTDGDVYIGVVGPVRTGKSTLISRMMEELVLSRMAAGPRRERLTDELPQSGSGKTIMTTQPKFVPSEAVSVTLDDQSSVRVRMVDSVGYLVEGALGTEEDGASRMVHTPWFDYDIPFEQAAEIGTRKVITDHATIGLVVTTDGSIADLSRVWIQADLPESALAKVRIGANAKVTVPAYPGEVFAGRVGHIGASLDKDTRTVAARIEVANADGRLKPEMFATATIEVAGDKREAISLPDAAIVLMDGKPTVFVYRQGAYEAVQVEPGERIGGRTVLKSGLMAGDQVVASGTYALKARKLKSQLGHGH